MKEIDGIAPKIDYRYQKQILEMCDSIPVPVIREPSGAMPPPHRERDTDGSPAANTREVVASLKLVRFVLVERRSSSLLGQFHDVRPFLDQSVYYFKKPVRHWINYSGIVP